MDERQVNQIGKYLIVHRLVKKEGRKTEIWRVKSTSDVFLGEIKWYGAWRQYCFFPEEFMVFNSGCLKDLCRFLDRVNREHKEKR